MNNQTMIPDDLVAMLDEYEILAELGRGGVSVVYRARERELDREVAIKVIRTRFLEDDEARARVDREARTLARLHHPNIVTLLGARRLPDGRLALVMQLARGATLRTLLKTQGPFSVQQTADVLRQVGTALAYLHRRGIVHRDVKPENIFLEDDGRVLLSDLGIAKTNDVPMDVTLTGVIVGTPAYMSPEQIDGTPLDGRSDQYSLGLVAHELLVGRKPWEGENLYSVIFKQKNEPLPPLAELRPDAPLRLRHAIERANAKDRDDRWPDLAALVEHLEHLEREPREHLEHRVPSPLALRGITVARAGPAANLDPAVIAAAAAGSFEPGPDDAAAEPAPAGRRRHRLAVAAVLLAGVAAMGAALALTRPVSVEQLVALFTLAPAESAAPPLAAAPEPVAGASVVDAPAASLATSPPAAPLEPPRAPAEPAMSPAVPGSASATASDAADARPVPAAARQVQAPPAPQRSGAATASALRAQAQPEPAAELEDLRNRESMVAVGGSLRPRVAPRAPQPGAGAPAVSTAISPVPRPGGRYVAPVLQNMATISAHVASRYPQGLAALNLGGIVGLELRIDEHGRVLAAELVSSSGHANLDAVGLSAAQRMRFAPAQRNGVPVAAEVRLPLDLRP